MPSYDLTVLTFDVFIKQKLINIWERGKHMLLYLLFSCNVLHRIVERRADGDWALVNTFHHPLPDPKGATPKYSIRTGTEETKELKQSFQKAS